MHFTGVRYFPHLIKKLVTLATFYVSPMSSKKGGNAKLREKPFILLETNNCHFPL